MTTLQKLVMRELAEHDEIAADIVQITVGPARYRDEIEHHVVDDFDELAEYEGDTGFGTQNLPAVYVWTDSRVYFKVHYDGSERVESVPRNPSTDEPPMPFGGG